MSKSFFSRIVGLITKRWPDRFEVLAPCQCHFVTVDLPDGVRVSTDFIRMNYLEHSPFAEPGVIFLKRNTQLLLWFFKTHDKSRSRFIFPQSYILARGVALPEKGIILVWEDESNTTFILLKDGVFCTQLVKSGTGASLQRQTIALLSREYRLLEPTVRLLTKEKKEALLSKGFTRLGPAVVPGFWVGGGLDRERFKEAASSFAPLLLFFLLLTTLFQAGAVWLQQKRLQESKAQLEAIQARAEPVFQARNALREEVRFWNSFSKEKTEAISLGTAYMVIAEAVAAVDGELKRWSGVKNVVTFMVSVKDAAALLDDLRSNESLVAIRFDGSVKKERNTDKQLATIVAEFRRK